jgi:hypothetical protein
MGSTPDIGLLESIDVARYPLVDGDWFIALRNPVDLLEPRFGPWRDAIVAVSTGAFGTDMSGVWSDRFAGDFLQKLFRWLLVFDADDNFVASAGYRATTIDGNRLAYWETSSVLPSHRGHGTVNQLEVAALALESKLSGLPAWLVTRTRSPVAYRMHLRRFGDALCPQPSGSVPEQLRELFTAAADWLGLAGLDATTGRIAGTYSGRPPLYPRGEEPVSSNQDVNEFMATLGPEDGLLLLVGPDAHEA